MTGKHRRAPDAVVAGVAVHPLIAGPARAATTLGRCAAAETAPPAGEDGPRPWARHPAGRPTVNTALSLTRPSATPLCEWGVR